MPRQRITASTILLPICGFLLLMITSPFVLLYYLAVGSFVKHQRSKLILEQPLFGKLVKAIGVNKHLANAALYKSTVGSVAVNDSGRYYSKAGTSTTVFFTDSFYMISAFDEVVSLTLSHTQRRRRGMSESDCNDANTRIARLNRTALLFLLVRTVLIIPTYSALGLSYLPSAVTSNAGAWTGSGFISFNGLIQLGFYLALKYQSLQYRKTIDPQANAERDWLEYLMSDLHHIIPATEDPETTSVRADTEEPGTNSTATDIEAGMESGVGMARVAGAVVNSIPGERALTMPRQTVTTPATHETRENIADQEATGVGADNVEPGTNRTATDNEQRAITEGAEISVDEKAGATTSPPLKENALPTNRQVVATLTTSETQNKKQKEVIREIVIEIPAADKKVRQRHKTAESKTSKNSPLQTPHRDTPLTSKNIEQSVDSDAASIQERNESLGEISLLDSVDYTPSPTKENFTNSSTSPLPPNISTTKTNSDNSNGHMDSNVVSTETSRSQTPINTPGVSDSPTNYRSRLFANGHNARNTSKNISGDTGLTPVIINDFHLARSIQFSDSTHGKKLNGLRDKILAKIDGYTAELNKLKKISAEHFKKNARDMKLYTNKQAEDPTLQQGPLANAERESYRKLHQLLADGQAKALDCLAQDQMHNITLQRVLLAETEREYHLKLRDFLRKENDCCPLDKNILLTALKQHFEVTDTLPLKSVKPDDSTLLKLQGALEQAKNNIVIVPIEIAPEGKYGAHLSVIMLLPARDKVQALYFDPFYLTEAPEHLYHAIEADDFIKIDILPSFGYFSDYCIIEFASYVKQNPLPDSDNKEQLDAYKNNLLRYLDSQNLAGLPDQFQQVTVKHALHPPEEILSPKAKHDDSLNEENGTNQDPGDIMPLITKQ